jgi:hypothetical protein
MRKTFRIPENLYQFGFRTTQNPCKLNKNKLIIEDIDEIYFQPTREYFDFTFDEAINQRGQNISEYSKSKNKNITVEIESIMSDDEEDIENKIRIKSNRENGGFSLYDLGHAIHLWEKYSDLKDHEDGNTLVYEICINNNEMTYNCNT